MGLVGIGWDWLGLLGIGWDCWGLVGIARDWLGLGLWDWVLVRPKFSLGQNVDQTECHIGCF